jgi:Myb/SANT-like DNA-binding domain
MARNSGAEERYLRLRENSKNDSIFLIFSSVISFWTHDEWRFALKLYAENLQNVGPGLRYQTKAQMFAHIAKKLVAIGSDKTTAQVTAKFKNMKKELNNYQLSDDNVSNETILQKYESNYEMF